MYHIIEKIETPPTNYEEWLDCFNQFSDALLDKSSAEMLGKGSCDSYNHIKPYLHREMQKAINLIINGYVKDLKREIHKYLEFNGFDNLHIPFIRFARKIENSLFFLHLDFLDETFKKELYQSVVMECYKLWNSIMFNLKRQILELDNNVIEDEYYQISRIKLFKNFS